MSLVRKRDKVIAILCADIHLCSKPPRARRKEQDWFAAMADPLAQLKSLSNRYKAPILCAGDVFDHWRASPELINFALNHLPEMYAVPGQHDLPLHNINLIEKSAFWTMVLSGRIHPVFAHRPVGAENNIVIHGFPWGFPLSVCKLKSRKLHVALVHDYFWMGKHAFKNAPADHESSQYEDRIQNYHAVAFGDNHRGFLTRVNDISVLNCGTLMRRRTDEAEYEPQVGLLCESGNILIHKFTTFHETLRTEEDENQGGKKSMLTHDMDSFLNDLETTQRKTFDFLAAIEFALKGTMVTNEVRQLILHSLEEGKHE